MRSETSRSAQKSSRRSLCPELKSPRKWTFSDPDGLCRRTNRLESSRASTIGNGDDRLRLLGEPVFEREQKGGADGERDYGGRHRDRPHGGVGPAAIEEDVLVRDDVRRDGAREQRQPPSLRHLPQLVDDRRRPEEDPERDLEQMADVAEEGGARRERERDP